MYLCLVVLVMLGFCVAVPKDKDKEKSECKASVDIILVIDGSDSIIAKDFSKQKKALKNLVNQIGLGPKQARIGIVVYSTTISEYLDLTYNKRRIKKWINNMVHPRDGTNTSLGIAKARGMFRKKGRKNVPWVCIVITDGNSKEPAKTANESLVTRNDGVSIFAVGISHEIKQTELEAIASNPSSVLMLQTFDQLNIALSGLMKVVCPCPPPPAVAFAYHDDDGNRSIGSIRRYKCEPGYQPMGNDELECLKDSKWSPLEFACLDCPPPPTEYGNGIVVDGRNTLDTIREYKCKQGFSSPHQVTSQCVPGPKGPYWTTPEISCLSCPPIKTLTNGYHDPVTKAPEIGAVIKYRCNPGYLETGPIETTCISDGGVPKWTKFKHRCITCKRPPRIDHADVDPSGSVLVNSVRYYKCKKGYHASGPLEAICMGEKGATYWHLTDHKCNACKNPPHLDNAQLIKPGNNLVNTVRVYTCLKGFQRTGPLEATCIGENGVTFWDGPVHRCVACIPPPEIDNAILDPLGDTLVGSIRSYKCREGYIQTGPLEVGCIEGTGGPLWTGSEFHCVACDPPTELPYAILDPSGSNLVGHYRRYHCLDGYAPTKPGPITIQCVGEYHDDKGRAYWSGPSHYCTACGKPPKLKHARVLPGENTIGSERRYNCTDGFHETGPIYTICQENAEWSKPDYACEACGPPPDVDNAKVLPGNTKIGSIREYKCLGGLIPDKDPVVKCLPNAQWSNVTFMCVGCYRPPNIDYAVLEPGDQTVGAVRRYTCIPGFLQTGPITTTCAVPDKSNYPDWSRPVHYCKDCGYPPTVDYAEMINGTRTLGSTQKYVCHKGFVPSGPPYSFCMPNAEWSPPKFKCIVPEKPKKQIVYVKVPVPVPVYIPVKPVKLRKFPKKKMMIPHFEEPELLPPPKFMRPKFPKKRRFKPDAYYRNYKKIPRRDPMMFARRPHINLAISDKDNIVLGRNIRFLRPKANKKLFNEFNNYPRSRPGMFNDKVFRPNWRDRDY